MDKSENAGIIFPEILIPDAKVNLKKWAVIACDQYTSNEDYWIKVSKIVGGAPSTLHIMVPEAYIRSEDLEERISHAKETMGNYIEDGVLVRLPKGTILVERETPFGTRLGIMLAVDLEKYELDGTKKPLIRATEQTVAERIPPRMKLREGAVIECPHTLLLIDDIKNSVIGPVYDARKDFTQIYNTELMQDGGNVKGWFIEDEEVLDGIIESIEKLNLKSKDGMLFAVGDGNHSLACAKEVWDKEKKEMSDEQLMTSPLRYALVEVINLYDNGLSIEPIHRVLFNVEPSNALRALMSILNGMGCEARMMYTRGTRPTAKEGKQVILFESRVSKGRIEIAKPQHKLLLVTLTLALDKLLKEIPKAEIDYIHGDEEFHELAIEHSNLGFLVETMEKDSIFDSVAEYGVLPRKAFSLGRPDEKRYYFECRLLVEAKAYQGQEEQPQEQQEDIQEIEKEDIKEIETEEMQRPAEDVDFVDMMDQESTDTGRKKKWTLFNRKREK